MSSWWRPTLNPKGLSQGDLIADMPHGLSVVPPVLLKSKTLAGGVRAWTEHVAEPSDATQKFLYEGRFAPLLVVSHGCDLDKQKKKPKVLVALVRPITALNEVDRLQVMEQRTKSKMPLPGAPGLGDMYADLRIITTVERSAITEGARLASMTDDAVLRLQVQMGVFFLRLTSATLAPAVQAAAMAAEEAEEAAG